MFGKRGLAQLDAGIEHVSRVERFLDLNKEVIEFVAEHPFDELRPNAAVAVLTTNRSAEPIQHGRVDLLVSLHHFLEVATIVDIQQRDDMRVPVSDMAEDGHRDLLSFKKAFQVTNQLADMRGRNDDIVDEVDRFLSGVESIERRIQCLSGLPELLPTLR